jgi:hypothetical protein
MRGHGTETVVRSVVRRELMRCSIVMSVFAIVILSVIGSLFKVRKLHTYHPTLYIPCQYTRERQIILYSENCRLTHHTDKQRPSTRLRRRSQGRWRSRRRSVWSCGYIRCTNHPITRRHMGSCANGCVGLLRVLRIPSVPAYAREPSRRDKPVMIKEDYDSVGQYGNGGWTGRSV